MLLTLPACIILRYNFSAVNSQSSITVGKLDRYGMRFILLGIIGSFAAMAVLLITAGSTIWINAYIYSFLLLSFHLVNSLTLMKHNPTLLNERGKFLKKDTKKFDRIFFHLWRLATAATIIIAGLDSVRFGWTSMPFFFLPPGSVILMVGYSFSHWSMLHNTHFEYSVRIQHDRNHKVCTSGPYRYVRHPGYIGLLLITISAPFILQSWWSGVPTIITVILVIYRTIMEDRTLQRELDGYKEYTDKVRYKLIPGLW
jgi:protein-S-isoprenylcysteine O-methyltransferase Ste14